MSTKEGHANIGQVLDFLRQWDRGDYSYRGGVLRKFLRQNEGKTFYDLELSFAQVASLFLARITVWMAMSYKTTVHLELQLKAIGIFLAAANHDQYLIEFMEGGGVVTLLDIVAGPENTNEDKVEALHLLVDISNSGRKYKEFICENKGVYIVSDYLVFSEHGEIAGAFLASLSHGNPKYQDGVYKHLIDLLASEKPRAQLQVLHTLHAVQLRLSEAHECIVKPLLNMLKSLHFAIQVEAMNLIIDLRNYKVKDLLLSGLVNVLKPNEEELQQKITEVETDIGGSFLDLVQKAAAAKTIRLLAWEDEKICRELLLLGVVKNLLYTMGIREHAEAQIQASLALKSFITIFPEIERQVRNVIGEELFTLFKNKTDTFHLEMQEEQLEILLLNKANICFVREQDEDS